MSTIARTQDLQGALRRTASGGHLDRDDMRLALGHIMDGRASQAQIGAFLISLAHNRETVDELIGAARALRERAISVRCVRRPLLDVCGTGGDRSGSFNISTATAFVVAGAGIAVAKHGNRAISSGCGSADVLEALGIDLDAASSRAENTLALNNIAFIFAQLHHPAMRSVAAVRRELGVRTLFNLVGPLTNPADPTHQVVGVSDVRFAPLVAEALRELGRERAAVICAADGMDEASVSCATRVVEWTGSTMQEYDIAPEMAGLSRREAGGLVGGDARRNAEIIMRVLAGAPGPRRDVVVLNAALGLWIAGAALDLAAGARLAERSIDSGAAAAALDVLMECSP